jgi:gas vesicle protein
MTGLALGIVVGSAVTMLFTPRSGAETRLQLETGRRGRREGREPSSTVDELVDLGLSLADLARDRFNQALAAAQVASAEARAHLLEEWSQRRDGGARPTSGATR